MARIIFSSGTLLKALIPHIGASRVEFRVAGGFCSLWSDEATSGVPCESRFGWCGTACLPLEKTLAQLHAIADQPIVLDLHQAGPSTLYSDALADPVTLLL